MRHLPSQDALTELPPSSSEAIGKMAMGGNKGRARDSAKESGDKSHSGSERVGSVINSGYDYGPLTFVEATEKSSRESGGGSSWGLLSCNSDRQSSLASMLLSSTMQTNTISYRSRR